MNAPRQMVWRAGSPVGGLLSRRIFELRPSQNGTTELKIRDVSFGWLSRLWLGPGVEQKDRLDRFALALKRRAEGNLESAADIVEESTEATFAEDAWITPAESLAGATERFAHRMKSFFSSTVVPTTIPAMLSSTGGDVQPMTPAQEPPETAVTASYTAAGADSRRGRRTCRKSRG